MYTMLDAIGFLLEQPFRNVPRQLERLSEEQLNQPLDLPETNTLYQLETHMAGATEFWLLSLVGGQLSRRDREAEFRSTGTLADLQQRYAVVLADVQRLLAGRTEEDLNRPLTPPPEVVADPLFQQYHSQAPLTVGYALLHMMRHNALHVGHLQLTLQLLGAAA